MAIQLILNYRSLGKREEEIIRLTLEKTGGNKKQRQLHGLGLRTLQRKATTL